MKRTHHKVSFNPLLMVLLIIFVVSVFVIGVASAVASATVSPDVSKLPPAKQTAVSLDTAEKVKGQLHPATIAPDPTSAFLGSKRTLPTPELTSAPRTGISQPNAPYHSNYALFNNQWTSYVGGQLVTVYAGGYTERTEQGLVVVQIGNPADKNFLLQEYATPLKEGKVKITAVNGLLVSLQTEKGTPLVFDFTNRAFR